MFRFAVENLRSRPLRTCLALAGLVIAIASMTILFSIAAGIDAVVQRTFAQIPGLAVQETGSPLPIFSTLPADWKQEIQQIPGVAVVDGEIVQRLNVLDGKTLISPPRFLLGLELADRLKLNRDIYRENLINGRFLMREDIGKRHCLISRQIAADTGKKVGETLLLNRVQCTVVGIYDTGSLLLDVNILMDLSTLIDIMHLNPATVSGFYVETTPESDPKQVKQAIEAHFVGRNSGQRKTPSIVLAVVDQVRTWLITGRMDLTAAAMQQPLMPSRSPEDAVNAPAKGKASAVDVRLAQDWADRFSDLTGDLRLFLGLITTMGITIALLSIINTMMMSVTERMTEFGILRANGWSRRNVMQLMTLESAMLGVFGGLFGVALGWAGTQLINSLYPDRLQLVAGPTLLLFGAIFSTVLGILGGLYPAWRAANRSPMEAIRRG